MAKSGPRGPGRPREHEQGAARTALVQAAIDTLREEGVVGASARAIAGRAGVNSAAVFYHFGSVNDLLLAALDESTRRRIDRYRDATATITDLPDLLRAAAALMKEDEEDGHIAVMATMVGGGAAIPGLGPAIAERVQPWIELATGVADRVCESYGLAGVMEPATVARLVVSLCLGIELLAQLEHQPGGARDLLDEVDKVATLVTPVLQLIRAAR